MAGFFVARLFIVFWLGSVEHLTVALTQTSTLAYKRFYELNNTTDESTLENKGYSLIL